MFELLLTGYHTSKQSLQSIWPIQLSSITSSNPVIPKELSNQNITIIPPPTLPLPFVPLKSESSNNRRSHRSQPDSHPASSALSRDADNGRD